jgi:hypothetical protein
MKKVLNFGKFHAENERQNKSFALYFAIENSFKILILKYS